MPTLETDQESLKFDLSPVQRWLAEVASEVTNSALFEKSYKSICQKFLFLLHYLDGPHAHFFQEQLHQCFQAMSVFIASMEPLKFGHRFPLLSYNLKKLEGLLESKMDSARVDQIKRNAKPWAPRQFESVTPISKQELQFLKSDQVSKFFQNLHKDQIKIQDFRCVCCAQVFIKNSPILSSNPFIPNIVELSKKNVNKLMLQRIISSLCNAGGGAIIIGAEKSEEMVKATGIKWKNIEEFNNAAVEVRLAMETLRPMPYFEMSRVIVHSNYMKNEDPSDEFMRFCLRVLVVVPIQKAVYFIQYPRKYADSSYELYTFNSQGSPTQILSTNVYQKFQTVYDLRKNNRYLNSHANILCCKAYYYYSYRFGKLYEKGQISESRMNEEIENQAQEDLSDEPKFKYRNMSLLITNSKKNERYVLALEESIKNNKMQIEVSKPFTKSFSQSSVRSIWIASHQAKYTEIKTCLAICYEDGSIKEGAIKMMPVTKKIFIEPDKFDASNEEILSTKFRERYGTMYIRQQSVSGQTLQLIFHAYSEAIYAFMVLEEMEIRGRFMNDMNSEFSHF